jgi:hypothetical protein
VKWSKETDVSGNMCPLKQGSDGEDIWGFNSGDRQGYLIMGTEMGI